MSPFVLNARMDAQADDQGYHALQWAALNNRVACCSFLLERGAPVNAMDTSGQNALHWAAVRGSLSAAETLLRAGADLAAQDCRGYTVHSEGHCGSANDCASQQSSRAVKFALYGS